MAEESKIEASKTLQETSFYLPEFVESEDELILKKTNHLLCHYMSKTLSHVSRQNSRLRTRAG
jgi:hypothetical protein